MIVLPLDPAADPSPRALQDFLRRCRDEAVRAGKPRLASISLEVGALDPLAVLESIFEPGERHFYAERPSDQIAVAGAEAVLSFTASGPERFAACHTFAASVFESTIAVGPLDAPFAGPHCFAAFTFFDTTAPGEPFEAASVFVPRWQVAHRAGRTIAVANLAVGPDAPIEALTEKVWRAHAKFRAFDYVAPEFSAPPAAPRLGATEVGPADGYRKAVARAVTDIAAGRLEKIVLARAKDIAASGTVHPLRALNRLRQSYGDCYAFSVANGRGQSFIGASPERLLRAGPDGLLTEALAGSIGRGETASKDASLGSAMQHDDKERREHRIVLEAVVARLRELGLDPKYPETPGLRRFAHLQHLHTPVRASRPEDFKLFEAVGRLHPTPAVGGSPREAAAARIRADEPFPRGLYAGALGWLDARGEGEFFVGLRSALINGPGARLYAGAGIVTGSSPEREQEETELKFRAMEGALLG